MPRPRTDSPSAATTRKRRQREGKRLCLDYERFCSHLELIHGKRLDYHPMIEDDDNSFDLILYAVAQDLGLDLGSHEKIVFISRNETSEDKVLEFAMEPSKSCYWLCASLKYARIELLAAKFTYPARYLQSTFTAIGEPLYYWLVDLSIERTPDRPNSKLLFDLNNDLAVLGVPTRSYKCHYDPGEKPVRCLLGKEVWGVDLGLRQWHPSTGAFDGWFSACSPPRCQQPDDPPGIYRLLAHACLRRVTCGLCRNSGRCFWFTHAWCFDDEYYQHRELIDGMKIKPRTFKEAWLLLEKVQEVCSCEQCTPWPQFEKERILPQG